MDNSSTKDLKGVSTTTILRCTMDTDWLLVRLDPITIKCRGVSTVERWGTYISFTIMFDVDVNTRYLMVNEWYLILNHNKIPFERQYTLTTVLIFYLQITKSAGVWWNPTHAGVRGGEQLKKSQQTARLAVKDDPRMVHAHSVLERRWYRDIIRKLRCTAWSGEAKRIRLQ